MSSTQGSSLFGITDTSSELCCQLICFTLLYTEATPCYNSILCIDKLLASLHSGDPLFRILHISSHQSFVQYRSLLVKMVKVNSYSESPPPAAVHGN